jgi:hypothetical protein
MWSNSSEEEKMVEYVSTDVMGLDPELDLDFLRWRL